MNKNPLVSVVVVTYNSSKTVIETLDSIAAQTYQNIEIIVTDDCSKDDTVNIVRSWLDAHKDRFVRVELVTVKENTGTVANINRGNKLSHGSWIKSIAGDDMLFPEAIEEYVSFIRANPTCKMCVAGVEVFSTDNIPTEILSEEYKQYLIRTDVSLEEQKCQILKEMIFPGPTYYYSKELYDSVGGFDERYILSEEWAFCYNVLNSGNRIYTLHKPLIKYRLTSTSVCRSKKAKYGNPTWVLDNRLFFLKVRKNEMLKRGMYLTVYMQWLDYTKRYVYIKNGDTIITSIVIILLNFVNPATYINLLRSLARNLC